MDIEITAMDTCRVVYSENIAGRGIAILISWLGTAGPVDCFNRNLKSIVIFNSMPLKQGTQLIFTCMITLVTFLLQLIIHFQSLSKSP